MRWTPRSLIVVSTVVTICGIFLTQHVLRRQHTRYPFRPVINNWSRGLGRPHTLPSARPSTARRYSSASQAQRTYHELKTHSKPKTRRSETRSSNQHLTTSDVKPKPIKPEEILYLITPEICQRRVRPVFIVFVTSNTDNFNKRLRLRSTWANESSYPTGFLEVIYVVGRKANKTKESMVYHESQRFKDVLFYDYLDSYDNLTYKTVVSVQYILQRCRSAEYVVKSDDDVVINLPAVQKLFLRSHGAPLAAVCMMWTSSGVHRAPGGLKKFILSETEFPTRYPDKFPPFCSGTGWSMTFAAVSQLFSQVPHVPFLRLEDVYFTGLLAESLQRHTRQTISYINLHLNYAKDVEVEEIIHSPIEKIVYFMQINSNEVFGNIWRAVLVRNKASNLTASFTPLQLRNDSMTELTNSDRVNVQ